jgi:diguanylate cyclase (GGDEF)-like protein
MIVAHRTAGGRHRAPAGAAEVVRLRHEAARLRAVVAALARRFAAEHHAANHDELTGLPNRRAFYAWAGDLLAEAGSAAVMLVDLDDFKQVNDTLGHAVGDEVLVTVGERLAALGRQGWLTARLGGDEFAALRTWPAGWAALEQQAAALAADLAAPMRLAGRTVQVGASIGAVAAALPAALAVLLSRADAALYRSKAARRPAVWDPARDDDTGYRARARPAVRTRDLRDVRVPPPVSRPNAGPAARVRAAPAPPVAGPSGVCGGGAPTANRARPVRLPQVRA